MLHTYQIQTEILPLMNVSLLLPWLKRNKNKDGIRNVLQLLAADGSIHYIYIYIDNAFSWVKS